MHTWIHKIFSILTILLVTGFTCLLGFFLSSHPSIKNHDNDLWLDIIQALSGGIFLAVLMLDIFPEVQELETGRNKRWDCYPLGYLCVCLGFLMMILFEAIIKRCRKDEGESVDDNLHSMLYIKKEISDVDDEANGHAPTMNISNVTNAIDYGTLSNNQVQSETTMHEIQSSCENHNKSSISKVTAFLFSITIHSIFEGMIIGIQKTTTDTWIFTGTILSHKSFIAFSIGSEISQLVKRKGFALLSVGIFLISAPIGQLIGILMSESNRSQSSSFHTGELVLQSVAGGTFMYIVFLDILSSDFINNQKRPLTKCFCALLGVFIIATVKLLTQAFGIIH